jgi:hypothetical protein
MERRLSSSFLVAGCRVTLLLARSFAQLILATQHSGDGGEIRALNLGHGPRSAASSHPSDRPLSFVNSAVGAARNSRIDREDRIE